MTDGGDVGCGRCYRTAMIRACPMFRHYAVACHTGARSAEMPESRA
ncbi:hypothetical protein LOC54_04035 [Acetobacter sp. AN02]|nr:hypothetical protein [Acetobacter sp. AN02]MDG6094286.1 hypothetical protein [Acetobacter sp. AN02]